MSGKVATVRPIGVDPCSALVIGCDDIPHFLDGEKEQALTETKPLNTVGKLSRRAFMIGLPVTLAACQSTPMTMAPVRTSSGMGEAPAIDEGYRSMYGPITDEPFPVAAVDLRQIDPRFYRQVVNLPSDIQGEPGSIVVDPPNHFLYLIFENGTAIRYGVGVGREGFAWSGDARIQAKREWPTWHPPVEMMARDKEAAKWPNGMPGGPGNPLGARAMYLFQGKQDTLFRLHGTTQPWSIGKSLSSGCIRMMNQDVIDLYSRVPIGTKVHVVGDVEPAQVANPEDAPIPPSGVSG